MEEQQVWARGILVLGSLIMVAAVVFVVVGLMLRDRGLGWLLFAGPGVALVGVVMLVLSAGLRRSAARVALDMTRTDSPLRGRPRGPVSALRRKPDEPGRRET